MSDASNSNQKFHHNSKPKPFGLEIWNSSRICEYVDERELTSRREVISHGDLLQLARNAARFVWVRYAWARWIGSLTLNVDRAACIREIWLSHQIESRRVMIALVPLKNVRINFETTRQASFSQEFQAHWIRFLGQIQL